MIQSESLAEAGQRPGRLPVEQICQRQMVLDLRCLPSGVHPLELADGLGRIMSGKGDVSRLQERLEVGRIAGEDVGDICGAFIVLALGEGELHQEVPCRNKVGSLPGHVSQNLPGLFRETGLIFVLRVVQPGGRSNGRQVGGRFERLLHRLEVFARRIDAGHAGISGTELGVQAEGRLQFDFCVGHILLAQIDPAQRRMVGSDGFVRLLQSFHLAANHRQSGWRTGGIDENFEGQFISGVAFHALGGKAGRVGGFASTETKLRQFEPDDRIVGIHCVSLLQEGVSLRPAALLGIDQAQLPYGRGIEVRQAQNGLVLSLCGFVSLGLKITLGGRQQSLGFCGLGASRSQRQTRRQRQKAGPLTIELPHSHFRIAAPV